MPLFTGYAFRAMHTHGRAQPTQAYRILDAATGELERGTVLVADMIVRQPWDTDLPITVTSAVVEDPISG